MQNYKNHIRYYVPHHFVFYPIIGILFGVSLSKIFTDENNVQLWVFITLLLVLLGWLSFMLRQHYALTLQNRIVVLELRFRYYSLTGQRLEPLEEKLSFGQLAALRFSSDEEFPALVKRTLDEALSSDDIKKSIKNWLPDHNRV